MWFWQYLGHPPYIRITRPLARHIVWFLGSMTSQLEPNAVPRFGPCEALVLQPTKGCRPRRQMRGIGSCPSQGNPLQGVLYRMHARSACFTSGSSKEAGHFSGCDSEKLCTWPNSAPIRSEFFSKSCVLGSQRDKLFARGSWCCFRNSCRRHVGSRRKIVNEQVYEKLPRRTTPRFLWFFGWALCVLPKLRID